MATFAIYNGGIIVNVITAESKEIAEEVTGMHAIETNGEPWIGWSLYDDEFRPPKPFKSWIWNEGSWQAPIPMPETGGPWNWNEELGEWQEVVVED